MNEFRFQDLSLGQSESFTVELGEKMLNDFLAITGDTSPIHVDESYAQERGFSSRVVYGMLTSSFYSTLVGVHLPGKFALLKEVKISMIKPVYLGDVLTITGTIDFLSEATKHMDLKASIVNQNMDKVSKAKIGVAIHD